MCENVKKFKIECEKFLLGCSITDLRAYGRYLQFRNPTTYNKPELVQVIISVLCGEIESQRNKRGAPIKNAHVDPKIIETIERLKAKYFYGAEVKSEEQTNNASNEPTAPTSFEIRFLDSANEKNDAEIVCGQLEIAEQVARLIAKDGDLKKRKIYIPVELVRKHDLREGDVLTCATKNEKGTLIAEKIIKVNHLPLENIPLHRPQFDLGEIMQPMEELSFLCDRENATVAAKYVDFLVPVLKGQRCCVRSTAKIGKTSLIFDLAKAVQDKKDVEIFVLLVDQAPETVMQFKNALTNVHLIASTFEDDAEEQVYLAEFILKRAKRFVESGKDVLLFVDSFNALANAYNQTDLSSGGKVLAGGLESKTVRYIKKFLGTARRFESGNSLTIFGALSENTGNPADDILAAEMSSIANYQLYLDATLVRNRVFPAIDYQKCIVAAPVEDDISEELEMFMLEEFPHGKGERTLMGYLSQAKDKCELYEKLSTTEEWD